MNGKHNSNTTAMWLADYILLGMRKERQKYEYILHKLYSRLNYHQRFIFYLIPQHERFVLDLQLAKTKWINNTNNIDIPAVLIAKEYIQVLMYETYHVYNVTSILSII